jgi:hypothetical protein
LALGRPRRIFFRPRRRRWGRFSVIALAFAGAIVIGASGGALPVAGSGSRAAAAVAGENVAPARSGLWAERKKEGQGALPHMR